MDQLIALVMLGSVPAYFIAQPASLIYWTGRWRIAAMAPLLLSAPALIFSVYALAKDSDLWPLAFILAAALGTMYLAVLWVARRVAATAGWLSRVSLDELLDRLDRAEQSSPALAIRLSQEPARGSLESANILADAGVSNRFEIAERHRHLVSVVPAVGIGFEGHHRNQGQRIIHRRSKPPSRAPSPGARAD